MTTPRRRFIVQADEGHFCLPASGNGAYDPIVVEDFIDTDGTSKAEADRRRNTWEDPTGNLGNPIVLASRGKEIAP